MIKRFTGLERLELQQMEQSIIVRIKFIHKKQSEIIEFQNYYKVINDFVDSLSNEDYIEQFDLLEQIEHKLNLFYVDMSPVEFDSAEFSRLKYLIKNLLSKFDQRALLNSIILLKNKFLLIDSFM